MGLLSGMGAPKVLRLTHDGGEVQWPAVALHTRASALVELRMLLAGRAAEEVLLGAPSSCAGVGPESDLAKATLLARRIETEWGMGDGGLIWHPAVPVASQHMPWLRSKLDHLLTTAQSQARAIIATHRGTVEALAEELLFAREMKGPALEAWVTKIRDLNATAAQTCAREGVIPLEPG